MNFQKKNFLDHSNTYVCNVGIQTTSHELNEEKRQHPVGHISRSYLYYKSNI